MAESHHTDVVRQTASKGNSASPKWGRLLYRAGTDRRRIGLEILIRLAAAALAMLVAWSRERSVMIATAAVFAVFCAWPLLHMGDRMDFYENGILHLGTWYPIGANTQVTWVGGQGPFLPTTWLGVSGCGKRINVSFIKDAQKLFNRAYNNAVYEKGE